MCARSPGTLPSLGPQGACSAQRGCWGAGVRSAQGGMMQLPVPPRRTLHDAAELKRLSAQRAQQLKAARPKED